MTDAMTIDEIEARISGDVPIGRAPKVKPWVDLMNSDCRLMLKELDANSVDAVVTDPPYGLSFMGKHWDYDVPGVDIWREVLRVLKPGGHLLSFGGSRTYHRMAVSIEDAGFEIRDQIMWLYGSGFPKSSNQDGDWEGWGTALKPAHEPIVVARKPLIGTMVKNLAAHGVGALNIDGCRVGDFVNTTPPGTDRYNAANFKQGYRPSAYGRDDEASADRRYTERGSTNFAATPGPRGGSPAGRWPANIIHDGSDEVLSAFPVTTSGAMKREVPAYTGANVTGFLRGRSGPSNQHGDSGSAARFFYCAKASKQDRDEGMTTPPKPVVTFATANGTSGKPSSISEGRNTEYRNTHPTVKPTNLMRYLTRLVTPPNGVVLDPFMGSGSTGRGAILEGFNFIGIEMSPEYFDIADARIAAAEKAFME
jgi:site-specific DNA-methyltransferase (adenine-specific)